MTVLWVVGTQMSAVKHRIPRNLTGYVLIEITGKCNLRCKYCYNEKYLHQKPEDELTTEQVYSIFDQFVDFDLMGVGISGGEPFLRQDLFEILEYSKFPISVLTNGTLLSSNVINRLKKIQNFRELRVSLDGFAGHDTIRGKDTSKVIVRNLNKLYEKGIRFSINTMCTSKNVKELLDLYMLIRKWKGITWRIDIPFKNGRFIRNFQKYWVDSEKLFETYRAILLRYIDQKPGFKLEIVNIFKPYLLNEGFYKFGYDNHPCQYTLGSLTIRPNGDVSFCPSLDIPIGNVKKEKIRDILNSNNRLFNLRIKDIKDCQGCKYLPICGTGCRADAYYMTGDLYSRDPIACESMKMFEKYILPILPLERKKEFKRLTEKYP